MRKQLQQQAGFTLVEVLTYIAILLVVTAGSLSVLFDLDEFIFQLRVQDELFTSGTATMERILTELRQAEAVVLAESEFASSTAGALGLDNGATITVFSLASSSILVEVDGEEQGAITGSNVTVEGFTVYRYTLTKGELVRVKLKLSSSIDDFEETLTLYGAATIRGAYDG